MMWEWNGTGWWWWFLMPGGMLLFWAFVAWVVVQAIRWNPRSDTRAAADPEAILAARFARGEIDAEEYRKRLDVLRGGPAARAA